MEWTEELAVYSFEVGGRTSLTLIAGYCDDVFFVFVSALPSVV
jgi:hypothetical protein